MTQTISITVIVKIESGRHLRIRPTAADKSKAVKCWRGAMVAQLFRNQWVVRSSRIVSTNNIFRRWRDR